MNTYVLTFCIQSISRQWKDLKARDFAEMTRQVVDEATIVNKTSGTKAGDVHCISVEFLGLNDNEAKRTAREAIAKINHVVGTDSGSLFQDMGRRPRKFVARL